MEPFPGYQGKYFSMPHRNVVPKPLQTPHPPLWVACSNRDTIRLAARLGIGALTFAFVDPSEAKYWVDEYYTTFTNECEPLGRAVNPNVAMVLPMMLHPDEATAIDRGIDGAHFFGYSLGHYYYGGTHLVGGTDLWQSFGENRQAKRAPPGRSCRPPPRRLPSGCCRPGLARCAARSAPRRR